MRMGVTGRQMIFAAVILAVVSVAIAAVLMPQLGARFSLIWLKATGQFEDLDWRHVIQIAKPGSGISVKRLVETRNPFLVIRKPRQSAGDLAAGAQLFQSNCASCHGALAEGGPGGPALVGRTFTRGNSDWAIFRTIAKGVPGTAMIGRDLPDAKIWQLVAHVDLLMLAATAAATPVQGAPEITPVTATELEAGTSAGAEWLAYSGSYNSQRHSQLAQINRSNVSALRVEWMRMLDTEILRVETTPLVRNGIMFVTVPPNQVMALEAATGIPIWTYVRELPAVLSLCCKEVNRGLAILGDKVYVGTLDAHLVALDAATGRVVWDVEVAKHEQGASITAAPLAVRDMIVTGIAGGEYGIRGFLDAYDAASGAHRWRFYTVPSPGEPGGDTWSGDSWRTGGAPTWLTGSFDPELNLLYWGVGNPAPNFIGDGRAGDNLYSNSVIVLDATSGRLRWHFQFTPHDEHDWDAVQIPVLANLPFAGASRKLLLWANRNAFYYVLDRSSGEFLVGKPYVRQTWADGLDSSGRPIVRPSARPSPAGSLVYPGLTGGTNWWSPAFNPVTRLFYVPSIDRGSLFFRTEAEFEQGEMFAGSVGLPIKDEIFSTSVRALVADTGELAWEFKLPPRNFEGEIAGLLSTAGMLVFGADRETFFALDAASGQKLWSFPVGGHTSAAPMTFELGGRQYVSIAASRNLLTFALPPTAALATAR